MAESEQWPPRSPLKALLSSPSGRKRYREYQSSNLGSLQTSPNKLLGSPSLLDKLRAARADRDEQFLEPQKDDEQREDDDEDEEMLQLKLQAIEARLKLKRLQQQKDKARPDSSVGSTISSAKVEVALSPTKRIVPTIPKSPSRVVLGIDKGVNAADVSLKRARTVHESTTKQRDSRGQSPFPKSTSERDFRPIEVTTGPVMSFSERMANIRNKEKSREEKQLAAKNARSARFKIDQTELAGYHEAAGIPSAAEHKRTTNRAMSPSSRPTTTATLTTETRTLKHSQSMPSIRTSPIKSASSVKAMLDSSESDNEPKGDATLYEPFSNTHLATRILPHGFLKRTLPTEQFHVFTLPKLLRTVTSPAYEVPDDITDYVVFGIVASKSSPRDHKARTTDTNSTSTHDWEKKWDDGSMNRQKFIVMTLTDLKWTIDLFLFDTAVPRYHRLTPGTLVAILNPSIMPPKRGREDTGAFSLALHNGDDQILEIGKSKHLAYCTAKRKDGSACNAWVDGSKTSICEWHLNAELDRTRSKRMGVNSMSSFGGGNGGSGVRGGNFASNKRPDGEKNFKRGFDYEAQSFYYAVGGTAPKHQGQQWSYAPTYNPNLSTAKLLDSTNPDDPFIASGQMAERDKQDRLRKRMVAQEKEREIARKLGGLGHKGGAGGEYFKSRTAAADEKSVFNNTNKKSGVEAKRREVTSGPGITVDDIMRDVSGESKKRAAESIRLSPVKKKTRFLTSTGIKVAGRESLGSGSADVVKESMGHGHELNGNDDDDDDDLDIV